MNARREGRATPYSSSQRMAEPDGHFLTINGFGHTELLNPNACAQDFVSSYLIDGTLPPEGAQCSQDEPPFRARLSRLRDETPPQCFVT